MTLNRHDLAWHIAERSDLTLAQATDALGALEKAIVDAVAAGEAISLTGFLKIETVERAAREGRNPRTGESIQIAATKAVKLSPGAALKTAAKGA